MVQNVVNFIVPITNTTQENNVNLFVKMMHKHGEKKNW
jgi:hypothetical protein